MQAFKPKGFIFLHCCANCKYGRKLNAKSSALEYICSLDVDNPRHLTSSHICDVDMDRNGEQISWFDQIDGVKEIK